MDKDFKEELIELVEKHLNENTIEKNLEKELIRLAEMDTISYRIQLYDSTSKKLYKNGRDNGMAFIARKILNNLGIKYKIDKHEN